MGRIAAEALARAFEEIIGWPYVSPGSNDANGIDCSGAFVRAYRKHGLSLYHGSNTIFRKHCTETGPIQGDGACLRVGMAVFKQRMDGGEPDKYKGDGRGNMYHIGLVTGVHPLRIVHATPPVAKVDTALGPWAWYGRLAQVEYEDAVETGEEGHAMEQWARVISPDGNPVKLRPTPSTGKPYTAKVAPGIRVLVGRQGLSGGGSLWAEVVVEGREGYMQAQFLALEGQGQAAAHPAGVPEGGPEASQESRLAELERLWGWMAERLDLLEERMK